MEKTLQSRSSVLCAARDAPDLLDSVLAARAICYRINCCESDQLVLCIMLEIMFQVCLPAQPITCIAVILEWFIIFSSDWLRREAGHKLLKLFCLECLTHKLKINVECSSSAKQGMCAVLDAKRPISVHPHQLLVSVAIVDARKKHSRSFPKCLRLGRQSSEIVIEQAVLDKCVVYDRQNETSSCWEPNSRP